MFGSDLLIFQRPDTYLYSGGSGSKTLTVSLPTGGCYLRCEASNGGGTVKVIGISNGVTSTETISSFDASFVGVGTKKWTSITSLTITGFTSITIFPATSSGSKIVLSSTSNVNVRGTLYSDARTTGNVGDFTKDVGEFILRSKSFHYNPRLYTLKLKDKIVLEDDTFEVKYVNNLTSEESEAVLMMGR